MGFSGIIIRDPTGVPIRVCVSGPETWSFIEAELDQLLEPVLRINGERVEIEKYDTPDGHTVWRQKR